MALINAAVLDGMRIVIRQAETLSSTPPTGPAPTSATTTSAASAETSVNGSPTSPNGNNQGNNNGNSPLLFFVALGFGVVFTNLWIIVGVKYCFRYNARNRQMRVNEDGEPITLENMPRPHRRRREKKLMTMDEVNEKFPMQKYKSWVASRAHEGLSTRGGVDVPPSRAGSVRSVQGVIPDLVSKERSSTEERPTTSATKPKTEVDSNAKPETQSTPTSPPANPKTDNTETETTHSDSAAAQLNASRPSESEEDDEHINAALPPEFMTSGDTCAICIDSLDDDEDVRGLTCGHAFHAVCVDPWLTSRRACCPLCKADYYTPKPRPAATEGTTGAENTATGVITVVLPENGRRSNRQPRSQSTWMSFRSRGRSNTNGNNASAQPQRRQSAAQANTNSGSTPRSGGIFSRFRPAAANGLAQQPPTGAPAPSQPQGQTGGFLSSMRLPFGRGQQQQASNATTPVTPSQLEAGTATQAR